MALPRSRPGVTLRAVDFTESADVNETGFTPAQGELSLPSPQEGFSGAISLPLLPDLLQIYTVSMADGALTIRHGGEQGTVWFERGDIIHAVCGEEIGEEAVYRLLRWPAGQFSLDRDARAPLRSITGSWQTVLMEGCRRLDERADDVALAALEQALDGVRAVAVFDAGGHVIAQRSRIAGLDLAAAGANLAGAPRPQSLIDCFWITNEHVHLTQPLRNGRLLHLIVDRASVNLALMRRAVDRVMEELP